MLQFAIQMLLFFGWVVNMVRLYYEIRLQRETLAAKRQIKIQANLRPASWEWKPAADKDWEKFPFDSLVCTLLPLVLRCSYRLFFSSLVCTLLPLVLHRSYHRFFSSLVCTLSTLVLRRSYCLFCFFWLGNSGC